MSTVKPERDDPRGRTLSTERARRDAYRSLVGFVVGKVSYAVPTAAVREITTPAPVTELPHLPHGVIGVFDHRGLVVPVIDLRACFGVTEETTRARSQWIIVDARQHRIGLVVNRVTGVFEVGFGGLKPVPEMGRPIDPRNLVGVTTHYGQMTFVLDVGAFHAYTLDLPIAELPAG